MAQDLCILMFIECHIMLAITLATPVGNFVKTYLEGTLVYCWIAKLFPPILMFTIVQNRVGQVLLLASLGVNVYPWKIVGLNLITSLNIRFVFAIWHGTLSFVS